jgi:hypothetical protein
MLDGNSLEASRADLEVVGSQSWSGTNGQLSLKD